MSGSISLDEIAFFGFNDVSFESLRDNLTGFPKIVFDANRRFELSEKKDEEMLLGIARDTWKFFENARDPWLEILKFCKNLFRKSFVEGVCFLLSTAHCAVLSKMHFENLCISSVLNN